MESSASNSPSDVRGEAGGALAPVRLSRLAQQEQQRDADREDDEPGGERRQAARPAHLRIRRAVFRRELWRSGWADLRHG
jgi:hypothetical protein